MSDLVIPSKELIDPLTSSPEDGELDKLATKIRTLRLEDVALFFLETHLPLANVIAHLAYLIPPVFGKQYLELLKDPKSIEILISKLKS